MSFNNKNSIPSTPVFDSPSMFFGSFRSPYPQNGTSFVRLSGPNSFVSNNNSLRSNKKISHFSTDADQNLYTNPQHSKSQLKSTNFSKKISSSQRKLVQPTSFKKVKLEETNESNFINYINDSKLNDLNDDFESDSEFIYLDPNDYLQYLKKKPTKPPELFEHDQYKVSNGLKKKTSSRISTSANIPLLGIRLSSLIKYEETRIKNKRMKEEIDQSKNGEFRCKYCQRVFKKGCALGGHISKTHPNNNKGAGLKVEIPQKRIHSKSKQS